ncbi:MAG: hypothetical protein WD942_10025 [Dehalococcoidia bacterium]
MSGLTAKLVHTYRNEGLVSVMDRSQRYLRYRLKRAGVDAGPALQEWSALKDSCRGRPRDVTATDDDDESHFDPRYFGKGA